MGFHGDTKMSNQLFIQKLISRGVLKNNNTLYIKYKKVLQQDAEILNEIIAHTSFLQYDADLKARIHSILKGITKQPTCSTCNTILKMRMDGRYRYTFSDTCGSKCFSSKEEVKKKRKQTNMKKYGSGNFLTSEQGSKQRVDMLLEKYGVDNAGKIESGKIKRKETLKTLYGSLEEYNNVRLNKQKDTIQKKYGVDHQMHHPDIKQKQQDTCKERYGVNNVWYSEEIQQKRFDTMREKYDVEYALQNDTCREKFINTMIDKYGVEHALQIRISPDSLQKLQNKEWLTEQHHTNKHTLTSISEILEVAHSTVGAYFKKHDIEVLTSTQLNVGL